MRRLAVMTLAMLALAMGACTSTTSTASRPGTSSTSTTSIAPPPTTPAQALRVQVFLSPRAKPPQLAALRAIVEQNPEIESCFYLDHRQSYENAVKIFKAKAQLAAIASLTVATSPPVVVCKPKQSANAAALKERFEKIPGVFVVEVGAWPS
jgi:cell division protein FtsX